MSMQREVLNSNLQRMPPDIAAGKRIRAVVVDDSPGMLEATCAVLEEEELIEIVARANDGAEAVQAVAALYPELVVMDVNMPGMDGMEAARLITRYFPLVKMVLMSGDPAAELREKCCAAGAHEFLFKVDLPHQFPEIIRKLFRDQ